MNSESQDKKIEEPAEGSLYDSSETVDAKDVKLGADSSAENHAAAADERLATPPVFPFRPKGRNQNQSSHHADKVVPTKRGGSSNPSGQGPQRPRDDSKRPPTDPRSGGGQPRRLN